MQILGAVLAILDDTKVVVELRQPVPIDQVLTVFAEIDEPKLHELGVGPIRIPKGEVRLVAEIDGQHFLAQRFQSVTIEKKRRPASFMLNPIGQFLDEEVEVVTKGSWSATFDSSQSLGIEYPKELQIGDPVGVK